MNRLKHLWYDERSLSAWCRQEDHGGCESAFMSPGRKVHLCTCDCHAFNGRA